tara:strand:- start:917 stop:1408 length:492 start_codon:yes stop_codon:yes gene_type:complete
MKIKNTGEKKLNAADRLQKFLEGIQTYVTGSNIAPTSFSPEFAIAETLSFEKMEKLTQDDCFNYAYQLYQYADHIAWCRAQAENVARWCRENLGSILAHEVTQIDVQFMKYETKVDLIKRENDIARNINEWLMTADSRLELLKSREYNVRRKADVLIEKGKRK